MKVSVALVTFNQKKYIAEAIESILNQVVNFDYEIVVGDDCSDDGTRKILLDYQKKMPRIIRLLPTGSRKGMNKNFIYTINQCQGEYVAYLEGDDYWISKDKLQKQVDLMERNKNYRFCFHLVKTLNQDEKINEETIPDAERRREIFLEDLLVCNFIGTSSLMFRNEKKVIWPDQFLDFKMMDWPFYILLLEKGGGAGCINEVMSIYRIHQGGIYSRNSKIVNYNNAIRSLKIFNKYLNFKYKRIINYAILRFNYHLLKEYCAGREFFNFIFCFLRMVKFGLLNCDNYHKIISRLNFKKHKIG
jgi:glycosyltransferase involved in cell wall biosynthesis